MNAVAFGIAAFTEGPDSLLTAAVVGSYPSRVATSLFRGLAAGDPQILSITPSIQQNTQLASNGRSFFGAWSDADGAGFHEVHWAILDANGSRGSAIVAAGGDLVRRSVVSNGLDYLMLVGYGGPLVARRIAADGALLGETPLLANAAEWRDGAAVVSTIAGYLVVWAAGGTVDSTVITPAGGAAVPQEIFRIEGVPQGWSGSYIDPAIAWNGSEALLVITRVEQKNTDGFPVYPIERTARLEGFVLRGDGSLSSAQPLEISTDDAATGSAPVVASNGRDFLVAAGDERFAIGAVGVTSIVRTHTATPALDLQWGGTTYVLSRSGNTFEHVAPDGATIDGAYRPGVEGLEVASDGLGHLLLIGSESSGAGPLRAFSYTPADFTPLPRRSRAVSR